MSVAAVLGLVAIMLMVVSVALEVTVRYQKMTGWKVREIWRYIFTSKHP